MEHLELVDRIYSEVKQMIFEQKLKQGQKIVQEKLAADLGVSRSPLLKVLQRLEAEMLVESIPRRGIYVKKIDIDELKDVFECRAVLEGLSARLLAQTVTKEQIALLRTCFDPYRDQKTIIPEIYAKSDRQFHAYILEWSGNKIISRLEMLSNVHLKAFQAGLLRKPEETLTEHLAIIDAMEKGDELLSEKLMRAHIDFSLKTFLKKTKDA